MEVASSMMTGPPTIGQEGSLNGLMSIKNDVNHMVWPLQSPDLNPDELH